MNEGFEKTLLGFTWWLDMGDVKYMHCEYDGIKFRILDSKLQELIKKHGIEPTRLIGG